MFVKWDLGVGIGEGNWGNQIISGDPDSTKLNKFLTAKLPSIFNMLICTLNLQKGDNVYDPK